MVKKQHSIKPATSSELSSLAEERLQKQPLTTPDLSTSYDTMIRMAHELEVKKIKLEMQNEELIPAGDERVMSYKKMEDSLERYKELYDFAPVGYLTLEPDGRILEANLTAARILGVERSQLLGNQLQDFFITDHISLFKAMLDAVFIQKKRGSCELMLLALNTQHLQNHHPPTAYTVRLDATVNKNGQECLIILSDITEQKQVESELRRLTRALQATNHCNQALIHTANEMELLQKICSIMVEVGGYRMAWVGYAEQDKAKNIRAVAHAGFDEGYMNSAKAVWSDSPLGQTPTGKAIRTGEPFIIRDIRKEPNFKLLLPQALKLGCVSVQSIPLKTNKDVFGAITICSEIPNAFDTEETKLLTALADNLAYGITMLRNSEKREQAEIALRKSERNFRSITEQMADEVFVIDAIGTLTYVSPVVEQLFGYLPHEVIGHPFTDYIQEEDIPEALQVFNNTLQFKTANQTFEVRLRRKDSSLFDGEIRLQYYQDQDISGMIGLIRDISDRKLAALRAQEASDHYEATIEAAQIGTWDWNLQTGKVKFNTRWFEIVGYTPEELAPESIQTSINISHPDDFKESIAIAEKHFNGESPYYEIEYRMKHKNGHWVWFLDRGRLMSRTADGKPLRMLGTHIDITRRKQAEQALQSSERKFRSITEQMNAMVFLTDSNGTLTYVSPASEDLFGNLSHEMIGHSFTEFLAEEEISKALALFYETVLQKLNNRTGELKFCKKRDSYFFGEVHFQYYQDNEISGGIGIIHDVTERKHQEILQKQYELELKEKQHFLACIYEEVNLSIFVVDVRSDGGFRFKGINPIHEKMTGIKNKEISEKTPEEFLEPEVAVTVIHNYERCIQQGKAIQYEESIPFMGRQTWWRTILNPVRNEAGHIYRIVGTSENITERKQANDQLRKMSAAVEQSPAVVMITDAHGIIEYANPMFTKLTGYSLEEVKGKNPQILQSGLTPKSVYDELWKTIVSGNIWHGEWQNKKKNGELFWESVVISAIQNPEGVITNFVAVKEDITRQKKMVSELIAAKEHAEESDRLKSAFLANISHEIRTPMNGILGFSELLKEPHLTGEEQIEYLDLIQQSGRRMLNLINDLIDISRIEAGETKLQSAPTPVNKVLRDLHAFFMPAVSINNLQLHCTPGLSDTESIIETDNGKLVQILTNLLQNALKFTRTGTIDFGYTRQGTALQFYVTDTGIGIPDEMQEKIFDRFHQVDNTLTRNHEGSGLGLSITKAYVAMLGGKLSVQSVEGSGSTFIFTLPYNQGSIANLSFADQPSVLNPQPSAISTQHCILIVDDDAVSRLLLVKTLQRESMTVLTATNGQDAIDQVLQHPEISLVLLDLQLPLLNGYQAAKVIKQHRSDLPVIAQSAFTSKEDKQKAIEAGCNSYITKPINRIELLNLITELLSH